MSIAALVAWILTAAGGFVLLGKWISHGGVRSAGTSRFPPGLIFSHFGLAAAGLVLWIIYLINDQDTLAWVAFALLVVVALLGFTMLVRWLPGYRAGTTVTAGDAGAGRAARGSAEWAAEQHFPVAVVGAHGVLAVLTVVTVLLAALGVGS
jgi:hypothetical protein